MVPVYVVIPTRNRRDVCLTQINRLVPQLRPDVDRIVVVQDGDDTDGPISDAAIVRCMAVSPQQGVDRARTLGNATVPADAIIVEIDDHDLAEQDMIKPLTAPFSDPAVFAAYGDCNAVTVDGTPAEPRQYRHDAPFWDAGMKALGVRAYRKWVYEAVGGYPLDYYPANAYALMCMIEQFGGVDSIVHVPHVLLTVVMPDPSSVSGASRDTQEKQVQHIAALGRERGFKLPYVLPRKPVRRQPAPVAGPEPVSRPAGKTTDATAGIAGLTCLWFAGRLLGTSAGGGVLSASKMLSALKHAGWKIVAAATVTDSAAPSTVHGLDIDDLVPIPDLGHGVITDPAVLREVADTIDRVAPDVAFITTATNAHVVPILAGRGVPVVSLVQFWRWFVRDIDAATMAAVSAVDVPRQMRYQQAIDALLRSDAILANSEFTAAVTEHVTGRRVDATIYPPLDITEFRPDGWSGCNHDGYVLIMSGQSLKSIDELMEVARRMPDRRFVVAAADVKHSLRNRASVLSAGGALVPPNVTIHESWTDAKLLYANAAAAVVGTRTAESFSRTAAESRALGIPLVTTDAGNLAVINSNADAGVIVSRKDMLDPAAWEAAVKKALTLTPEPDTSWCRDDTPVFVEIMNRAVRSVGRSVTVRVPNAPGVSAAAKQLSAVHGVKCIGWHDPVPAGTNLIVASGKYDPSFDRDHVNDTVAWYWHSSFAQMDTSRAELDAFVKAVASADRSDRRWVFMTSQHDAEAATQAGHKRVRWLPCCLDLRLFDRLRDPVRPFDGRNIYLPGPGVSRKNLFAAIAAVSLSRTGATVHVTRMTTANCPELAQVAALCNVELVEHECATTTDVATVCAACQLTMILSTAETYSYAAAESVIAGTPVLAWSGIPAVSGTNPPDMLTVTDPTNVKEVADKVRDWFGTTDAIRSQAGAEQRRCVREVAVRNNHQARRVILEVAGRRCNRSDQV